MAMTTAGCSRGKLFDVSPARSDEGPAANTQAGGPPAEGVARDDQAQEAAQPAASLEPVDVLQINEDSITIEDVLRPSRAKLAEAAASMSPARYQRHLLDTLKRHITEMAREVLLYQAASRRLSEAESEMLDKFTDQRIRTIVQEEYGGRQVRWERAMAERGLSVEQAREKVRRELIVLRYLQQTVSTRIQEPTRRELLHFFEARKADLTTPERRELLLIEIPKGDEPSAALAAIEQVRAELDGGADFGETARKHSAGVQAAHGGSWGLIGTDSMTDRFAPVVATLFELPPGGTSGPVEGSDAFFLVRVGQIQPRQDPDFAEIQISLRKSYRDHQFNLLVDELVARLQEQATILPDDLNLFLLAVAQASPQPAGVAGR